jgi:hypothetical protein
MARHLHKSLQAETVQVVAWGVVVRWRVDLTACEVRSIWALRPHATGRIWHMCARLLSWKRSFRV